MTHIVITDGAGRSRGRPPPVFARATPALGRTRLRRPGHGRVPARPRSAAGAFRRRHRGPDATGHRDGWWVGNRSWPARRQSPDRRQRARHRDRWHRSGSDHRPASRPNAIRATSTGLDRPRTARPRAGRWPARRRSSARRSASPPPALRWGHHAATPQTPNGTGTVETDQVTVNIDGQAFFTLVPAGATAVPVVEAGDLSDAASG